MPNRLIPALLSLGFATFLAVPAARAEPAAACPADAEQTLFDMETAIRQGTQTDPAPIVDLAEWGIETCPDRPDVQAIASTLMSAALGTSADPGTVERYLTLMLTAIRQNDYAWNTKQKPSVLKQADGSMQNYFGYNAATGALLNSAIPYLIKLGNAGRLHKAISGEPYASCPFADGCQPAPYLASRGMKWIQRFSADTLGDADLKAYIEASYRLVAAGLTRKLQRELGFLDDGK